MLLSHMPHASRRCRAVLSPSLPALRFYHWRCTTRSRFSAFLRTFALRSYRSFYDFVCCYCVSTAFSPVTCATATVPLFTATLAPAAIGFLGSARWTHNASSPPRYRYRRGRIWIIKARRTVDGKLKDTGIQVSLPRFVLLACRFASACCVLPLAVVYRLHHGAVLPFSATTFHVISAHARPFSFSLDFPAISFHASCYYVHRACRYVSRSARVTHTSSVPAYSHERCLPAFGLPLTPLLSPSCRTTVCVFALPCHPTATLLLSFTHRAAGRLRTPYRVSSPLRFVLRTAPFAFSDTNIPASTVTFPPFRWIPFSAFAFALFYAPLWFCRSTTHCHRTV